MTGLPELDRYRRAPCGALSIPYCKARALSPPPGLRIVHNRDFRPEDWAGWEDSPYFRLYHDLRDLPRRRLPEGYRLSEAKESHCAQLAALLSVCYGGEFREAEVRSWREQAAFHPSLWLLAWETGSGALAGAALGLYDPEAGEGVLDWLQVHPGHRRRGLGTALAAALLEALAALAEFATVSGEAANPAAPEVLYRRCGFTGDDIWHILRKT